MAKKSGFDLGNVLAGVLPVSNSDTAEQITYLDIALLDEDKNNFYSVDGIDELAANIELIGLQQPLRVRENPDVPGRYLIVSGHRRRRAIWTLYEENPDKWGKVPCIIETVSGSPALQELRLIYANADTRRMSSADVSRQAERVEALLYQLKEEGYEFPGRMRDYVAKACKVSKTKIATLKVIRENLASVWKRSYEKGCLAESAAYNLAKLPQERQNQIYTVTLDGAKSYYPTEWNVIDRNRDLEKITSIKCKKTAGGGPCTNTDNMLSKLAGISSWASNPCTRCCAECSELISCSKVCPKLAAKQKQMKADRREAAKQQKAAEAAANAPKVEQLRDIWRRWDAARRTAKKSVQQGIKAGGTYYSKSDDDRIAGIIDGTGKVSPEDYVPYHFCHLSDVNALKATAELFGCTTDYLLGLTEDPKPMDESEPSGTPAPTEGCAVRWERNPLKLPEGKPVLTWNLTWVRVDERLPRAGEDVLTVDPDGIMEVQSITTEGKWGGWTESPTHWAPLPPAPGEEADPATALPPHEAALQFRSGTPDHAAVCWCIFSYGEAGSSAQPARWKDGAWHFYNIDATIDAECVGWIELPDYEEVLRK